MPVALSVKRPYSDWETWVRDPIFSLLFFYPHFYYFAIFPKPAYFMLFFKYILPQRIEFLSFVCRIVSLIVFLLEGWEEEVNQVGPELGLY